MSASLNLGGLDSTQVHLIPGGCTPDLKPPRKNQAYLILVFLCKI